MRFKSWFSLTDAAVFILFVVIGSVAAWVFFLYPVMDSGHVAGWVQAIGSIVAIASGFYVIKMQLEGQKELQIEEWRRQDRREELMAKVVYRLPLFGRLVSQLGKVQWLKNDLKNQTKLILYNSEARKKISEIVEEISSDLVFLNVPSIVVTFPLTALEISSADALLSQIAEAMKIDGDIKGETELDELFGKLIEFLTLVEARLASARDGLELQEHAKPASI